MQLGGACFQELAAASGAAASHQQHQQQHHQQQQPRPPPVEVPKVRRRRHRRLLPLCSPPGLPPLTWREAASLSLHLIVPHITVYCTPLRTATVPPQEEFDFEEALKKFNKEGLGKEQGGGGDGEDDVSPCRQNAAGAPWGCQTSAAECTCVRVMDGPCSATRAAAL